MTLVQISHGTGTGGAPDEPERDSGQPWHHIVQSNPPVLILLDGSRIYALPRDASAADRSALALLTSGAARRAPSIRFEREPSALSLNIAQSCNLACSYCYADEGRFGGGSRMMTAETAFEAIRRHIAKSDSRAVSIGFIGGEPFLNRAVLRPSVEFAVLLAARKPVGITFGITTNGTLLEAQDLDLLRGHRFAVTVSLDGTRRSHDEVRRTRRGKPSYEDIVARVAPLLVSPGLASVAARATLTRRDLDVRSHLRALAGAGFSESGVSPLRTGPDPALCLRDCDWNVLLNEMKAAAQEDWMRVSMTREAFRFSNLAVALKQLHRGAADALPCGSAASYVSLSAEGRYYTCHRTVGDPTFDMGDLQSGLSAKSRLLFAQGRHVDTQEPCRSCWARYLCGGGCHAEVQQSGRAGCDYIRGWLEYCISLYPLVLEKRPDLLGPGLSEEKRN